MSQDPPPTEGENIESAIYEVSRSIDNLVEVLQDKLTPKPEVVQVFIGEVPPMRQYDTMTICPDTFNKLDPAYHWKIVAERVK